MEPIVADTRGVPRQKLGRAPRSSKKDTFTVGESVRREKAVAVTPMPGSAEHLPCDNAMLLMGGPAQSLSANVCMTASAIWQYDEVDVPVDVADDVAVAVAELDCVAVCEEVADDVPVLVIVADDVAVAEEVAVGVGTARGSESSASGGVGPTGTSERICCCGANAPPESALHAARPTVCE